ncbi:radical SAM protein [Rugamonas rubra]|uniref:4Fe-4S single cluster domain-containing protein n=1 Tax=Rugamonas rubra TaxID=758825 RepID=A0A1I4TH35_9BURK|nr:radical SAM protein [Rugamonas rubra]SFM76098.1 4Fe-4S single cluster domain-containing protein [Rugamonas rubra]
MTAPGGLPVSTLYERPQALLNIYLTNRCNLRCRHCGTNSGPGETSFLALDAAALDKLRQAIAVAGLQGIHVSGGEPFLRRRDLRALAALARDCGVLLAINSNGFWGTAPAAAERLLESMPGITELLLSTDLYHAEFLAVDKLIVAAQAGLARGLLVSVVTTTPGARPSAFTRQLDAGLAAAGIAQRVRRLCQELGPTARAEPLREHVQFMSAQLPPGACRQLHRPTLLENGTVLACCNTTIAAKCAGSPLIMGQLDEPSLAGVLARGRARPLLQALRVLGPALLVPALPPAQRAQLAGLYPKDDICALCSDIMANPAAVASLESALQDGPLKRLLDGATLLAAT